MCSLALFHRNSTLLHLFKKLFYMKHPHILVKGAGVELEGD